MVETLRRGRFAPFRALCLIAVAAGWLAACCHSEPEEIYAGVKTTRSPARVAAATAAPSAPVTKPAAKKKKPAAPDVAAVVPAPKPAPQPAEPSAQPQPEPAPEPRPEPQAEQRPEPKPEPLPEPRAAPVPEPSREARADPNAELCGEQTCAALFRAMIDSPDRAWIRERDTPARLATGVRIYAYRTLRPRLTCEELSLGIKDVIQAAAALSYPVEGFASEQLTRLQIVAAQVETELRAERKARCETVSPALAPARAADAEGAEQGPRLFDPAQPSAPAAGSTR
jgi:hypothetical protein